MVSNPRLSTPFVTADHRGSGIRVYDMILLYLLQPHHTSKQLTEEKLHNIVH